MAENKYSELLKNPKWQKVRLEVMNRDNWKCTRCKKTDKTLNVHHTEYHKGKKPWEYDIKFLVTLCENCHGIEHKEIAPENPDFVSQLVGTGKTGVEKSIADQIKALQQTLADQNFKDTTEEEVLRNILFLQGEQRRLGYV